MYPTAPSSTFLRGAVFHDPVPVGGVAAALLLGTYGLLGVPVDFPLVVAGVCGVALVYAADRGWAAPAEDRINRPERVAWVRAHLDWLAAETAVLFALGGAMLVMLEWTTLLWIVVLGGLALLHVWPCGRAGSLLRGTSKPLVIAGVWAVGGTLLPLVEAGRPLGFAPLLFLVYRWLFILPNLLLADWSDRAGDAEMDLAPWAAGWAKAQVRGLASVLLFIAALGVGLVYAFGTPPPLLGLDAIGLLLMGGAVWRLEPSRPRDALLADLVVAWPLVPALVAWMMV